MTAEVVAYQLNVVLREVEPTVWRRLLVRSDTSIDLLHRALQIALGWKNLHLYKFRVHGRDYGSHLLFDANTRDVRLHDFKLRPGERFLYEYDFGDFWQHDLRVEKLLPLAPKKHYPMCVAGEHACPPEDCGGPEAYHEGVEEWHSSEALDDLLFVAGAFKALMEERRDARSLRDDEALREAIYRMQDREVFNPHNFDRKSVNKRLREVGHEVQGAGDRG